MPRFSYTPWYEYLGGYKKSSSYLGVITNAFRAAVNSANAYVSTWDSLQKGFVDSTYHQVTDETITARMTELALDNEVELAESLITEFMFPQVIRDFHSEAANDQEKEDIERASELEEQRIELIQKASMIVKEKLVNVLSSEQIFFQAMLNLQSNTRMGKAIPDDLIATEIKNAINALQEEEIKEKTSVTQVNLDVPKHETPDHAGRGFNWRILGFILICILGLGLPLLALISSRFRNWITRDNEPVSDRNKELYVPLQSKTTELDEVKSQTTAEHIPNVNSNANSPHTLYNSSHNRATFFQDNSTTALDKTVEVDVLEQELCKLLLAAGIKNDPPEYSAHLISLYAKRIMQAANPEGEVIIRKENGHLKLSIVMDEPMKYIATMHKTGKIGAPEIEVLTRNKEGNFTLTIDTKPKHIDLNSSFKAHQKTARHAHRICRFQFEVGSKVKQPFGKANKKEIKRFIEETKGKIPTVVNWAVDVEDKIKTALKVAPTSTEVIEESFFVDHGELKFTLTAAKLKLQNREMSAEEVNTYVTNMEDSYFWLDKFAAVLPADLKTMNTPMEYSNTVHAKGAPVLTQILMMVDHSNDEDWQYKKGEGGKKRKQEELDSRKGQASCPADLQHELQETALHKQVNFSRTIGTSGIITTLEVSERPTVAPR